MEMSDSLAVSVSGLDAQRRRLNVIASNLANAQSTKTPTGGPYKRRDVVFRSTAVPNAFQRAFRQVALGPSAHALEGVSVSRVIEDPKPGQLIYDLHHQLKGHVRLLQGDHRAMKILRFARHEGIDRSAGFYFCIVDFSDGRLEGIQEAGGFRTSGVSCRPDGSHIGNGSNTGCRTINLAHRYLPISSALFHMARVALIAWTLAS